MVRINRWHGLETRNLPFCCRLCCSFFLQVRSARVASRLDERRDDRCYWRKEQSRTNWNKPEMEQPETRVPHDTTFCRLNFFVLNLFRRNLGLVFTLVSDSLAGTRDSSLCPIFSFGKVWPNNGFLLTGLMHPPSEKPIYNHITDRAKCNFFK